MYLCRILSILVCQPFPCDWKYSTTSGLNRIETCTFRGSFWGPRTRFGMSGWFSLTGFIRDNISSESAGDSTVSQSSLVICLCLPFIIHSLTFICLTQAYYTNFFGTKSIDHHVKILSDKTEGNPSFFGVIKAIVNGFKRGMSLEIDSVCKINLVPDKISNPFVFVPFILHCLKINKSNLISKQFVYTIKYNESAPKSKHHAQRKKRDDLK